MILIRMKLRGRSFLRFFLRGENGVLNMWHLGRAKASYVSIFA